jgi:2-succinyl-5-enolpyruvyl-6-hydroxy-3-cyclohexene-1-carboxylate synthase
VSNPSTKLARHIVRRLIELGISDVVIAPGSRNAPLSLAFSDAAAKGLIRTHIRIDERGAAFYALGIAKATKRYVPVVSTSGTAVANFFPAVLEAYHSNERLLLLTADRPERLRKTGANQTTLQQGIFGTFVLKAIDTGAPFEPSHLLGNGGPVHFNLQFDEPLLPEVEAGDSSDWLDGIKVNPHEEKFIVPGEIAINQNRVVLVVGHDRAGFGVEEISAFARSSKAVVISEDPISFEDAIPHASLILSSEEVRKDLLADLVIVIGRTTLNRSLNAYISSAKRIMVIDPRTAEIDTRRSADEIHHVLPKVVATKADQEWRERWLSYFTLANEAISSSAEWSEGRVAAAVAQLEMDAFFVASSRPIRDIEAFAIPREGSSPRVFAHRGLAGIDGNVATAMGIAQNFGKTVALIGDLAFLHDVSALANGIDSDLTIIVVDNDGGGIFSTLPQRGVEHFEEVFGTPHGKDLQGIAKAFGLRSIEVGSVSELLSAYESKPKKNESRIQVIIATMPDREANADNLDAIRVRFAELARELVAR